MSKFDERLLNYTTPSGRKFELLEGEKLVIDGMDFTSSHGSTCAYLTFVTNKRIIMRQTRANIHNASVFESEIRTLNWEDVKLFKLTDGVRPGSHGVFIEGTFKDYSKEEKPGTECEAGTLTHGGAGLEYSNKQELHEGLSRTLKALSAEYGFDIYIEGKNSEWSTVTKERADEKHKVIRKKNITVAVVCLGTLAAMFGLLVGLLETGQNKQQVNPAIAQQAQEQVVPQFDPSTIVQPQRDATGQFDYVIQERRGYDTTCFSTAYPGSDGNTSKMFGCTIRSSWEPGTSVKVMDVLWSDGVRTTVRLNNGFGAAIGGGSNWERGTWEFYRHEGKNYFYIKADKGADTWIPTEAFDLGLRR